jgi:hypothetical protein
MKPTSNSTSKSTSDTPKSGPDAKEMSGRDLPKATFPGHGTQPFRVFLDKKVHAEIAKHAGQDVGVEICGVLVGGWKTDEDGPYVEINAACTGGTDARGAVGWRWGEYRQRKRGGRDVPNLPDGHQGGRPHRDLSGVQAGAPQRVLA